MSGKQRMADKLTIPGMILFSLAGCLTAAEPVEFNRDIRPVLTKHCTACHGGVKEAGGISFIYREKALAAGESGRAAIVPGKPEESEMVRRIKSSDPDEVMPQPKHGPPLAPDEVALIERWISLGGKWEEHWSFVPPEDHKPPSVSEPSWPATGIDHFILARLDREVLSPAPEAPAAEWLRRVTLDLTGLPPSPEELAAFEKSGDPAAAREQVADRLLASPHFGERWAAMWLDLARYSDTYGFEKDPHRDIWPYRDWVIRAFNEDMPYDRFTVEQLAGDLLPDATAAQRLATAFHRNTQTNTEGGTDDEEFRVAAVIDRVSTTWTTWQATTFGCVQCHDHPYDPIRHDEFYQFTAFFNNTEDTDLDDDFPRMRWADDPEKREEASTLETRILTLRNALNDKGRALALSTDDWSAFAPDAFEPSHGTLSVSGDGTIRGDGTLPIGNTHKISGPARDFTALKIRIFPENDDPASWPERGSVISRFEAALVQPDGTREEISFREIVADHLAGPLEPTPSGNFGSYPKLHGPRWFVLVPGQPIAVTPDVRLEIAMHQKHSTAGDQATPLRRFAIELTNAGSWSDHARDEPFANTRAELQHAKHALSEIPGLQVPVMLERPATGLRETRVFARGNRLSKEHAVESGVPSLLASGATPGVSDRLAMARWLVDGKNPLTARVMANRLWGELFGIGLVETMEDFGTSGTPPSHPELLDHLALRFQNTHRWSVKAMLREIVLSSTYRQTHRADAALIARDPNNRLLARGPRNRLSAEMIRDQALAAADLLVLRLHGPPVFPPQPEGVWNSVYSGAKWTESEGPDRYRRGIYTYSKRTSGFPGFLTFDAPSRDICSARRLPSNTPLQALVTMNDPAHIEAARALAKRMAAHSPDPREQLAHGLLLTAQRHATPGWIDTLSSLLAEAAAAYQSKPEETAKLASTPEEAALVLTANTLLNLDAALTK